MAVKFQKCRWDTKHEFKTNNEKKSVSGKRFKNILQIKLMLNMLWFFQSFFKELEMALKLFTWLHIRHGGVCVDF